ncbi:sulfotransferase 4A1-like isoform X2 [Anneissia japonica]|uniref:sulfotransferase 4A1-like isoform X1 n=1 Tax=Anneissia japonica TaxID=1529436 RepID=UPI001425A477|nr:sulfotransferase 4A1-like isoform X1 [Anneissia japonica]XP_033102016.1 sulfotransferase 4A1-like isoform X2 [Anneissia japonica]
MAAPRGLLHSPCSDENIMHYYVFKDIRLPPFCRGKMEEISEFDVREDDVWVISYPRAGLWLEDVTYLVMHSTEVGIGDMSQESIENGVQFLEYPHPGLETIKNLPSPRIIKTHLPYCMLPRAVQEAHCKVVYMCRNPKDVMCSFYDFHRMVKIVNYKCTLSQFFYRFFNHKLGYGSYFEHVLDWWKHKEEENLLILKYEDMKKNFGEFTRTLAKFIGMQLMPEQVRNLENYWMSQSQYNKREDRVGQWKSYFTVIMDEKFDELLPEKLKRSTLQFDYQ